MTESTERAIGRLQGEIKTFIDFEKLEHLEIHRRFDIMEAAQKVTDSKVDKLNKWKSKIVTSAIAAIVVVAVMHEPANSVVKLITEKLIEIMM